MARDYTPLKVAYTVHVLVEDAERLEALARRRGYGAIAPALRDAIHAGLDALERAKERT